MSHTEMRETTGSFHLFFRENNHKKTYEFDGSYSYERCMRELEIDPEQLASGEWLYEPITKKVFVEEVVEDTYTVRIGPDGSLDDPDMKPVWEWKLKGVNFSLQQVSDIREQWAYDPNAIYVKNNYTGEWSI